MRIIIKFIAICIIFLSSLHGNEGDWNGKWYIYWTSGSFILTLEQNGLDVNGTSDPSNGKIKGKVKDNNLIVSVESDNNVKYNVKLTMGYSGNTFFGNTADGEWISGIRVLSNTKYNDISVDLTTPLKSFYSFLSLVNSVRIGNYEILEKAMGILKFNDKQKELIYATRLALTQKFFNVLDECTVNRLDFFKQNSTQSSSISLEQLGTNVTVDVDFEQDPTSKEWKIVLPKNDYLSEKLKELLLERGKYEIDPNANLLLASPRDTIRTFYEQYERWEEGGKNNVIETLDLSEVDPAIHKWQAPLLSYYLKSVLDRISYVVYQEVPNDPKSKKPYVHFYHPLANVVIAPYEVDGKTKWMFTAQTLSSIDELYGEMENISAKFPTKELDENNLYFKLKNSAKKISPLLLHKIKYVEYWQVIMLSFILIIALALSFLIRYVVVYYFKKFYITKRWTEDMITFTYIRPIQIGTFALVLLNGAHQLGLPNLTFSVIKSFTHLLMVVSATWIVYNFISIIFSMMMIRAKRTSTNVDEIILSLTGSILRILVITVALFTIAEIFNIPYKTVIAGLGIGGLAFAIAAKDTIANFFGSAIIIADRPFKTGDRVKIGSDMGVITNVGIRSTKIRTVRDTLLTVPNNKITQEMIDNYSEREAMRFDTEFYFALDTSKEALDKLDSDLGIYLRAHKDVDSKKIILTGVNDYTKRGVNFGLTFFVKANNEMEYSDMRHSMMTDIAQIVKTSGIEMVMLNFEEDKTKS